MTSATQAPQPHGSIAEEYRAIRQGAAVALATPADRLELTGADRERFLNGQVTCDVRGLVSGRGVFGFFTDARGRVLAEVVVRALEDRFLLELSEASGEAIAAHMERYVIADRVVVHRLAPVGRLHFMGPRSGERLSRFLGLALPAEAWAHAETTVEGRTARLSADPAAAGHSLAVDGEVAAELFARWASGEAPEGVVPVRRSVAEAWRIERGLLVYGVDYGGDHFPQESGREEGVSYTKGCYLGQEVVARIHYRGGVNRLPRGLLFACGDPPGAGAVLSHEGREVGRSTSTARSPALGRAVGLGLVHKNAAEVGTRLQVEGGGEAEVAELPLVGEAQ